MTKPAMEVALADIRKRLRAFGISRPTVRAIIEELHTDLLEATGSGASIDSIIGPDRRAFAARIAEAHGRAPVPGRIPLLAVVSGLPVAIVAFFTYIVVMGGGPVLGRLPVVGRLPYSHLAFERQSTVYVDDGVWTMSHVDNSNEVWLVLGVYGLAAALGLALATFAADAALRLVRDDRRVATVKWLLVALPIGAIVGFSAAILFASTRDFSTRPRVIQVECILVTIAIIASIALARERARRIPPPPSLSSL